MAEQKAGQTALDERSNGERNRAIAQRGELGTALIRHERLRQVEQEGWTPQHDDAHDSGEMVCAAIAHLMSNTPESVEWFRPWLPQDFKPADRVRELTKAGALIAAEIDRLTRDEKERRR